MKYKYFHPRVTSFCSTCTEILTLLLSRGDFYCTYTEISTFSPSRNVFCSTYTEILTFWPPERNGGVRPVFSPRFSGNGANFWRQVPIKSVARAVPKNCFCSTYNEILTFLLSGGHFYHTYNEISTFSPSRNVFLLYV